MPASDTLTDTWPDLADRGVIVPARVGVDRRTWRMVTGWEHTAQNIQRLFATRFHARPLRRWVGSFVPHLLGELATRENILRFFTAIATALDLWEPCFSVERVRLVNADGTEANVGAYANKVRVGHVTFAVTGLYMPRGHLGDRTPEGRRTIYFRGTGTGSWERLQF
jgi:phage baseplate assembly protein W